MKRFCFESSNKLQSYLGDNKDNELILLSSEVFPRIQIIFGGADNFREGLVIEASDFVGIKGFKAKGKRLTTFTVGEVKELEPTRMPEKNEDENDEDIDTDTSSDDEDQMNLFED